jgi:dGTPase
VIERFNIRQKNEEKEEALSPLAVKSRLSRGRQRHEEPCPMRTVFQRDRDRIIYSKAFRRLKHKTQAFIAPQGDHYVTRLTHTLQVSQIARSISRALNLNEDLTEAIALAHDLGHTPFGHIGEDVLNEIYPGGFRHNEQSLRVVDLLENDGKGLNLTWEVRDGIVNHSKSGVHIMGKGWGKVNTLEGEIVKISDAVAWINHDIDDAIRAGVITGNDLPASATAVLGNTHRERINAMIGDIVEQSWSIAEGNTNKPGIKMSKKVAGAAEVLREFLFDRVYYRNAAEDESAKAREIVNLLYNYYIKHQDKMPPEYSTYSDEPERRVVDYIAGMTDRYAMNLAEEIGG